MKEAIRQAIHEFHEQTIPTPAERLFQWHEFPTPVRKVQVLKGMRRSGKTWLLYQHMQQLLKASREKTKLLYLNFEDDRFLPFQASDFQEVLSTYFQLYPNYHNDSDIVFYFDEIQIIKGWERFIRRLLDQEKITLLVTGSSAKMLSKEIATSLRGRSIASEVFPFSFLEYLLFHKITIDTPLTTKTKALIKHHAEHYLQYGGFPETLFIEKEKHELVIQDYINSVIFRDVIERYDIRNPIMVKVFLLHCLQNTASPLSINKIHQTLKSEGNHIGKNSLYEYLDYFQDAYALFTVPLFHHSLRKRQINPKKLYCTDPGIISAYSIKPAFEKGTLLENAVFIELRRQFQDIFYYKTKSDKEIDFVVTDTKGISHLYQVSVTLDKKETRQREFSALVEAGQELNIKKSIIISIDHEENTQINGHHINIIPFWKWAMHSDILL